MMKNKKIMSIFILAFVFTNVWGRPTWLGTLNPSKSNMFATRPIIVPATGTIEVAFSPNGGATSAIVRAIAEAKKTILVAAYSFTSKEIAKALLDAKTRGVDVEIILDKSQAKAGYSAAKFFANQQFTLGIDSNHAIFHDKYMVIDSVTVITGSFNFTHAADEKNAENVLIMRGNRDLALIYTSNWKSHYLHTRSL